MRLPAAGFAAGVVLLQTRAELPGALAWAALGLATLALMLGLLRTGPRFWRPAAILILAGVLGYAWAALLAQGRLSDALDARIEGHDLVITGVIAGLPQAVDRGVRFEFEVESSSPQGLQLPRRIQLAWYNGLSPEEFYERQPVRTAERWRFTVRLRRPHGSLNPHGFDYEAWLFERGIRATGYVRRGERQRLDSFVMHPAYVIERWREAIRERFRRALAEQPYAGVLVALAIGDQRAIAASDWQIFALTGVSHLMSISGLHVTMVSGLFAALFLALWRRIPALALRLPAQKAAGLAGLGAALAYCALSGFAVPAQRTLYMVAVAALALCCDRFGSASRVLALALLAVLLLDPWAVLAPGFWLSFGAVALIFYIATGRLTERNWWQQWSAVQWAVTVGLAPLLLALFGQVSLASPIANAIAIPLVSFVVTPLALAGAVLPFDAFLSLAHAAFAAQMPLLQWLAQAEGAVWQQHAPAAWSIPLALTGAAWMLAPKGMPARPLGAVLMLPMFALTPATPPRGDLWLTVLDVGQGLAIVARTAHHTLLYDAGPVWSAQSDSGSRIVLPYLKGEGIGRLDMLAVSDQDKDHAGGVASVLAAMQVGQLLTSTLPQHLAGSNVSYRLPCREGERWHWDGVKFTWLHPASAWPERITRRSNDASCVLRIEAAGKAALLTGDIERAAEAELLARRSALGADVLVVPHHGSGTSSTPTFVSAVGAGHAVFSVGYRNRFGHPKSEVWERYAGAQRSRTDRDGAVSFRFSAPGIAVERHREMRQRYWQQR